MSCCSAIVLFARSICCRRSSSWYSCSSASCFLRSIYAHTMIQISRPLRYAVALSQILDCRLPLQRGWPSKHRLSSEAAMDRASETGTYLSVFELLDAVFLALHPLCLHSVRPVADASLRSLLQVLSCKVSLSLVRVGLGLNNLSANAIELVNGDDCCSLLLLSVAGTHGVDTARVGRRRRLNRSASSVRHF